METITKEKIANMLKTKLGLSGVMCEEVVDALFASIHEIVSVEKKLTLMHFGRFFINDKKSRPGLNLHTKEKVMIKPRSVLRFSPAKHLKETINSYSHNGT